MNFIKRIYIIRFLIGIFIGGVAGYAYYYFIGCSSGTCPLTSNPYISIIYAAIAGGVLTFKLRKIDKEITDIKS